jgi:hypothetical protein
VPEETGGLCAAHPGRSGAAVGTGLSLALIALIFLGRRRA